MNLRKTRVTLPLLITVALATMGGCIHDDRETPPAPDPEPATEPDSENGISMIELDATAGGFGAQPDHPANKFTYFNLDSGQVVELTDGEAQDSTGWHIAFKRTKIKLNGGTSGPGEVTGALGDGQEDFYLEDGSPNESVFTRATAESELAAFMDVTSSTGLEFLEDGMEPAITGDGSSDGWWLYDPQSHAITANSEAWWLVRSAMGDSYAKMRVTDIEQTSRAITLEMFVQGRDESEFSTTPITWIAAIGAQGGSKCYDFDNAGQVDCSGLGQGSWDIMVEITGRDWNIWTNGTVKGFGKGKAFGKIEHADIGNYASGTTTSDGEDISTRYRADSSGLFQTHTWYAYDLKGNKKLWPNYRVYAIDTGAAKYKVQIINYYNAGGISGHITMRYAPILNPEENEI